MHLTSQTDENEDVQIPTTAPRSEHIHYLTPQTAEYAHLLAKQTYIYQVEDGKIPLLSGEVRELFEETLMKAAVARIFATPNKKSKKLIEYKKRLVKFFDSDRVILRLWYKFEIEQAEADGRLSPQYLVEIFLKSHARSASYGQRSELETYALRTITDARHANKNLGQIVRAVRRRLETTPTYDKLSVKEEVSS